MLILKYMYDIEYLIYFIFMLSLTLKSCLLFCIKFEYEVDYHKLPSYQTHPYHPCGP